MPKKPSPIATTALRSVSRGSPATSATATTKENQPKNITWGHRTHDPNYRALAGQSAAHPVTNPSSSPHSH